MCDNCCIISLRIFVIYDIKDYSIMGMRCTDMPEKDLQDYELLKRKYFKIAEVMKCAIWEYNIKTHTMHMVRKLDGKY